MDRLQKHTVTVLVLHHLQARSGSAAQPLPGPDGQQKGQNDDHNRGQPRHFHEPQGQPRPPRQHAHMIDLGADAERLKLAFPGARKPIPGMSLDCCTVKKLVMKGSKVDASFRWMATMLRLPPKSYGDSMPSITASGVPAGDSGRRIRCARWICTFHHA